LLSMCKASDFCMLILYPASLLKVVNKFSGGVFGVF
jgi:hypothetical protein